MSEPAGSQTLFANVAKALEQSKRRFAAANPKQQQQNSEPVAVLILAATAVIVAGWYFITRERNARPRNITRLSVTDEVRSGSFFNVKLAYADRRRKQKLAFKEVRRTAQPDLTLCAAFEYVDAICKEAQRLIDRFNAEGHFEIKIKLNTPAMWSNGAVEPWLEDVVKFNSNKGWMPAQDDIPNGQRRIYDAMQALSHFSYQFSNGELLLCDLQGAILNHSVILTVPALLSNHKRYKYKFGPTDLGKAGMAIFFEHHGCTQFCRAHWETPQQQPGRRNCHRRTIMKDARGRWVRWINEHAIELVG